MISPKEFVVQWRASELPKLWPEEGGNRLVRFDPARVEPLHIPEHSKQFLIEAGLPRLASQGVSFSVPRLNLLALPDILPSRNLPEEFRRYRLIGTTWLNKERFHYLLGKWPDEPVERIVIGFICLDEQEGGRVVTIINDFKEPEIEFINSSVPQLAECLLIYRHNMECRARLQRQEQTLTAAEWNEFEDQAIEELRANCQEAIEALKRADPKATEEEGYWYNVIMNLSILG